MIAEWDVAFDLVTPEGTLPINQNDPLTGRRFQLNPPKCSATLPVRSTQDDVPQGDGAIPHRRWRSGYAVHLAIEPLQSFDVETGEGEPACDAVLVEMLDLLGLHVNALIRTGLFPGAPNGRLEFSPSGASDDRMFDRVQLLAVAAPTLEGALGGTQVEVDLDTSFPYYIEKTETQTMVGGTGFETIRNAGNTDYYPVAKVYGPTSYFELTNFSVVDVDGNPLRIVYDETLPGAVPVGGGDYVEIIFFGGTVYLNGSGANRKAGIDMRYSDFFPLIPGDNLVGIIGAGALVLSNGAWA